MAQTKVSKKELSANNYIALLTLVSLAAVVISVLIGRGLVGQAALNAKVISAKSKADKQLATNLQTAQSLVDNYHGLGSKSQLIANSLPTTPDFPALLSQFELLVAASGNRMGGIVPTPGSSAGQASADTPSNYDLTLSVNGNYDSILRLLHNIEISARPLQVTGLSMSGSTTTMSAQIEMSTFYQGEATLKPKTEEVK